MTASNLLGLVEEALPSQHSVKYVLEYLTNCVSDSVIPCGSTVRSESHQAFPSSKIGPFGRMATSQPTEYTPGNALCAVSVSSMTSCKNGIGKPSKTMPVLG